MALHYHCSHCGTKLGTIEAQVLDTEQLGFDKLTQEERMDMIVYDSAGDVQVSAICDDCYELLQKNPDLHQNDYIIH